MRARYRLDNLDQSLTERGGGDHPTKRIQLRHRYWPGGEGGGGHRDVCRAGVAEGRGRPGGSSGSMRGRTPVRSDPEYDGVMANIEYHSSSSIRL